MAAAQTSDFQTHQMSSATLAAQVQTSRDEYQAPEDDSWDEVTLTELACEDFQKSPGLADAPASSHVSERKRARERPLQSKGSARRRRILEPVLPDVAKASVPFPDGVVHADGTQRQKMSDFVGTWVYGDGDHWYHIVESEGDSFHYIEREVVGRLRWDGHWLKADLVSMGRRVGEVRLQARSDWLGADLLVSQFRGLDSSVWRAETISTRASGEVSAAKATPDAQQLSDEQQRIVDAALAGDNIFFTGRPGTGKSFTLRAIISALREHLDSEELAICGSTGAAACHIGGGTAHSFFGCGLGQSPEHFARMHQNPTATRLQKAKVVVIDEISMLSGDFLQGASEGLVRARKRNKAFGGLQVILCGDFLQLPPVSFKHCRFAFQAPCWQELDLRCFELTENFRQAGDLDFQALLCRARDGWLTASDRAGLLGAGAGKLAGLEHQTTSTAQTTLFCRNVDVDRQNLAQLARLPGRAETFVALDTLSGNESVLERIVDKCSAPRELSLKIGARVLLVKNWRTPSECKRGEEPMVNGSVGIVVAFEQDGRSGGLWPVVRFPGGTHVTVERESFSGDVPGVGTYRREQLPLKLAWAISVHKSQGVTLDGGTVDLQGAFEEGQVYVALSRFRSLRGLTVLGLPEQLRVSAVARRFHALLGGDPAADGKLAVPLAGWNAQHLSVAGA
eukprot:TRINITY_DN2131_c0_g6_i1.p1 TRINITY_DN2131_c0_g6~~TRINITY_DN2131_c0_g6_i1.p1  ORF type:complete len:690 (-),score=114.29 TRINITY_DN2131_c0_g6_i1:69-2108(-)